MNIFEIMADIANNAPVDRAGAWLLQAADDYPELFNALTSNLDASPSEVKRKIVEQYPMAGLIYMYPGADEWITNLQEFFKNHYGNN